MKPSSRIYTFISALFLFAGWSVAKPDAEATGFVRVEQIDGVWWFISPEGEKFVSMGLNHVEPHLWLAPYNKAATLQRYGADMVDERGFFNTDGEAAKKWIDRQLEIAADLNFSTWGSTRTQRLNLRCIRNGSIIWPR